MPTELRREWTDGIARGQAARATDQSAEVAFREAADLIRSGPARCTLDAAGPPQPPHPGGARNMSRDVAQPGRAHPWGG
jgi:hypothetical protein